MPFLGWNSSLRKGRARWAPWHNLGEITPITRVKSPQLPNYKAIYRGPITPFITCRGPSCGTYWSFPFKIGRNPEEMAKRSEKNTHIFSGAFAVWISGGVSSLQDVFWISYLMIFATNRFGHTFMHFLVDCPALLDTMNGFRCSSTPPPLPRSIKDFEL